MEIPDSYIIHDIRDSKNFKGITICGYKRRDVINAYQNSMINNKLEDSIRWCVELHATGLNSVIWDSLEILYTKYIHINNPKYFFYFLKREKIYKNIIKDYPKKHEIFSRNNQEIRNLYAELTAISSLTKKNNIFLPKSLPTINNKSFEKEDIQKRMISKNTDNIIEYLFNTTSSEIKLGLNEILNNLLSKNGTFQNCIYWYHWIEKVENLKKKNSKITIYQHKLEDHWLFILWKIILDFEKKLEKKNLIYIKKLESYYKKNFKISSMSKKKYLFFIAFYIIKTDINWNINIFQQEHLIIQSNININKMYKNIIQNIESELSFEMKNILYKKYNQLYFNNMNIDKNIILKKVKNTNLDEDINKVVFTNYPEYDSLKKIKEEKEDNNEEIIKEDTILLSKNMTLRDIDDYKEDLKSKKLDAFTQFIAYKKVKKTEEIEQKEQNKEIKTVLDYYNIETKQTNDINENNESNKFKNINFSKRK